MSTLSAQICFLHDVLHERKPEIFGETVEFGAEQGKYKMSLSRQTGP